MRRKKINKENRIQDKTVLNDNKEFYRRENN